MMAHTAVIRAYRLFIVASLVMMTTIAHSTEPDHLLEKNLTNHPAIELPNPDKLTLGKVVRIFDGDTILIRVGTSQHRYQLLGVNAPEFIPSDRTPEPYALEARRFVEQLLLDEQVYIQFDPLAKRDVSNQRIAYIFRAPDMLFVNLELIRQGYAKHTTRYNSLYSESMTFYASKAKELDRGIWNPKATQLNWTPQLDDPESSNRSTNRDEPSSEQQSPLKPAKEKNAESSSSTVYITQYGKSYHLKDCHHLSESSRKADREDIKSTHKPCISCKPNGEVLDE
jgi:micrococcal nuclease